MSIDRRIGLETAISQGTRNTAHSHGQAAGRQASDADRQAFEQAMSQGDADAPPAPPASASPFSLFGAGAGAAAVGAEGASPALAQALSETATQLLVADGSQGRRQVRVALNDDVLPGVSVSVYEDEGRVVADFVCANERSRERACAMAPELAAQLAQSLDRPTRVRVSTDDPEDPRLAQTDAPAPRD
ncbi:hypothetical protein [Achromobacter spanius]|uniref:hypothetical protein n=1 Tax=Achromobacter spanius TaxID=217203 RepID=UPI003805EB84